MKKYRKTFGRANRLTAVFQDDKYRWELSIRGQNLSEYVSDTIPDEMIIVDYFIQKVPAWMRIASKSEFRTLSGHVKESIRYLQKQVESQGRTQKENHNQNENQNQK